MRPSVTARDDHHGKIICMRGRSHVILGALGWLAAAPTAAAGLGVPMEPAALAVSTVACAGAALLPDLDHPDGTIAQSLGPVSRGVAAVLCRAFGGHRQASHGLLFAGVAAAGTQLGQSLVGRPAMVGLLFALAAFAVRSVKPPRGRARLSGVVLVAAAAGGVTAASVAALPGVWPWMPYAVGVGCLLHLVGDALTDAGVPLFWPFRTRVSVPLLAFPGDGDEKLLVTAMTGALAWLTIRTF